MIFAGAAVNAAAVAAGGLAGLLLKRWISKELGDFLTQGLGICVICIGLQGALEGQEIMMTILSMVVGGLLGHWIDFDGRLERTGQRIQKKTGGADGFAEGFVSYTILVCTGAMAIVGSMESGMSGNHEILFSKALIDGVTAVVMAASMGPGVALGALPVFLYEGLLTLIASTAAVWLTDPMIREMSCVGSLLIVMIGLNMLKLLKIRVANFIPAAFMPILFCLFWP